MIGPLVLDDLPRFTARGSIRAAPIASVGERTLSLMVPPDVVEVPLEPELMGATYPCAGDWWTVDSQGQVRVVSKWVFERDYVRVEGGVL